jgi:hypothetical protein
VSATGARTVDPVGGIRPDHLLTAEGLAATGAVGPIEVLVGVPTLNHARSVVSVLTPLLTGVSRDLGALKSAILVADAGSQDGTLDVVRAFKETALPPTTVAVAPCVRTAGPPRRGRAILAILAAARHLAARAVAVVDADLTSVAPEWVTGLVDPVLRGDADYVSPSYTLAAAEGTLTTNLLAPFARALYGRRVQQLAGGCAGLSARFAGAVLDGDPAEADGADHGVCMRLAIEALAGGYPVTETYLGLKRVDPVTTPDLTAALMGTVGPLFQLMERHRMAWQATTGSVPVPRRDGPPASAPPPAEPPPPEPKVERMVRAFRLGLKDLLPVWGEVMPEETLGQLYPLGVVDADEFAFPAPVWARVVSDFALAYHARSLPRDHLLRALTPLYLGRVAGFLSEVRGGSPSRIVERLEALGRAFEAEREYLRARWR